MRCRIAILALFLAVAFASAQTFTVSKYATGKGLALPATGGKLASLVHLTSPMTRSAGSILQTVTTTDPNSGDSGRAVLPFYVATTGNYWLSGYSFADDYGTNSFFVDFDSTPTTSTIWGMQPTGEWFTRYIAHASDGDPVPTTAKVWNLTAGAHTLYVKGREQLSYLSELTLVPVVSPVITNPTTITAATGTAGSYQLYTTGFPTLYGATSLPANVSIGTGSGLISWTSAVASGTTSITVTADNVAGQDSEVISFAVAAGATVPGAPTIGTGTATGATSASIAFTPPGSNGGSPITLYTAYSNPGSITGSGTASPVSVTGLTPSTGYTFTVKALNAVGYSAASASSGTITTGTGGGTFHYPANLSLATVQASINGAATGDTVVMAAGTASWAASLNLNKKITLRGAGAGQTIIYGNVAYTVPLIAVDGNMGSGWARITALTLDCLGNGGGIHVIGNRSGTSGHAGGWCRVDHCEIKNTGWTTTQTSYGRAVLFYGYKTYGLIDHNILTNNSTDLDVGGNDYASWLDPIGMGDENAVFFENNTINRTTARLNYSDTMFYNSYGSRAVVRYNIVNGTDSSGWIGDLWDSHGNNDLGTTVNEERGTIYAVVYENTIYLYQANFGGKVFHLRGGIHIMYDNDVTIANGGYTPYYLTEEECWYARSGGNFGPVDFSDYPRQDQVTNSWFWGNTFNGVSNNYARAYAYWADRQSYVDNVIQPGRDFFRDGSVPPAYNATGGTAASGPSHGYTAPTYPHSQNVP